MPIYKVRVYYTSFEDMEIEAKDEEEAEEKAQTDSGYNMDTIADNLQCDQCDIELSDCKYPANKELQDREEKNL